MHARGIARKGSCTPYSELATERRPDLLLGREVGCVARRKRGWVTGLGLVVLSVAAGCAPTSPAAVSPPSTTTPTTTTTTSAPPPTQVIAAGSSAPDLPTESAWSGAQDPPYVCCWDAQGQFVTFSFATVAGATDLSLRYSAGAGTASRKVEVDGSVLAANAAFPATADWSTWTAVTLNASLTAGPHTLKVWWDGAAGSHQFMNLDNLTVTSGRAPPSGVTVALGYANGTSGLTPWAGSPDTAFIGEGPQCCLTHGPDDGSPGFDRARSR